MKPLKIDDAAGIPAPWGPLAVYDIETETVDGVITPRLLVHLDEYDNEPKKFYDRPHSTCVDQYIQWLFETFEGTDVFAHNGSGFDHRLWIARHVLSEGASAEFGMSGSAPIIIRVQDDRFQETVWNKERNTVKRLLDSMRLLPTSLRAIGKSVGIEKDDVDRSKIAEMSDQEVGDYCAQDCRVLLAGLSKYRDVVTKLGGYYGVSSAGIASSLIRKSIKSADFLHFFDSDTKFQTYSPRMLQADEFCESALYGGRCEPFRVGYVKRDLYYYDLRSAYPWALTQELPWRFKGFHGGVKWNYDSGSAPRQRMLKILQTCGISDVEMFIPAEVYAELPPVLPTRDKRGRILYATGHLTGRWTNLELLANYDRCKWHPGFRMSITGWAKFESKTFAKEVIEQLYALRSEAKSEGDAGMSQVLKILMNAAYGKLAQHPDQTTLYYGPAHETFVHDAVSREEGYEHVDADLFEHTEKQFGAFRHIAAGAYVTAMVRCHRVLPAMEMAISQGARLYYCDTDSITVDKKVVGLAGPHMGDWEHEYVFSEAEFLCSKLYRAKIKWSQNPSQVGTWLLRVKGMNVSASDDKSLSSRQKRVESMQRWMFYVKGISDVCARDLTAAVNVWADNQLKEAGLEVTPKAKQGLIDDRLRYLSRRWAGIVPLTRSIKTLGKHVGTWVCHEQHQQRVGLHPDTCRTHFPETGDSIPLHLEEGDTLGDGRTLDAETVFELKHAELTQWERDREPEQGEDHGTE